jgi:hypothetical protein
VTPLIGWQQMHALSRNWGWVPHALLAYPLPPGEFDARIAGHGFAVSTRSSGGGLEIGDPFLGVGVALEHVPSGVSFDVGSTLFFAAAEHVSHAGVDRALVLHVTWRRPRSPIDKD